MWVINTPESGSSPIQPDFVGGIFLKRRQPGPECHVIALPRTRELEELEPSEVDQTEPIGRRISSPH